jgi:hypothetical protein
MSLFFRTRWNTTHLGGFRGLSPIFDIVCAAKKDRKPCYYDLIFSTAIRATASIFSVNFIDFFYRGQVSN